MQEIKNKQRDTSAQMDEAYRLLDWLANAKGIPKASKAFFTGTIPAIVGELNEDTVGRLGTFLSLARNFKATYDRGDTPTQSKEEVLSFAVSGWVLGDRAAEGDVKAARRPVGGPPGDRNTCRPTNW